jgi:hypothetical protein
MVLGHAVEDGLGLLKLVERALQIAERDRVIFINRLQQTLAFVEGSVAKEIRGGRILLLLSDSRRPAREQSEHKE